MSSAAAAPTKATINQSFSITVPAGAPPAVDGSIVDTAVAPPVMLIVLVVVLTPALLVLLVELKLEAAEVTAAPEVIVYAELAN